MEIDRDEKKERKNTNRTRAPESKPTFPYEVFKDGPHTPEVDNDAYIIGFNTGNMSIQNLCLYSRYKLWLIVKSK